MFRALLHTCLNINDTKNVIFYDFLPYLGITRQVTLIALNAPIFV